MEIVGTVLLVAPLAILVLALWTSSPRRKQKLAERAASRAEACDASQAQHIEFAPSAAPKDAQSETRVRSG